MEKRIIFIILFLFAIIPLAIAQVPPDKSLIKSTDSPKVYWFQNNIYYWILDEVTFNKMSPLWSFANVIEYPAATFNSQILNNPSYKQGPNFVSDNLLIKKTSPAIESTVFLTHNNQRRAFFNYDALIDPSYNLQEPNIISVTQTLRDSIFSGDFIYAVGHDSGRISLFRNAFNRVSGVDVLGYARTTTQAWGTGQIQYFKRLNDNSAIVYNPNQNYAYSTYGAIYTKYTARGANIYGFPIGDASDGIISSITGAKPVYQRFSGGSNTETSINHHFTGPRAGLTIETHSPILEKWASMGYGASCAGLPVSDVYSWQNGLRSDFENGYIYWDGATTTASCEPPTCTNDCNQGTTRCATSIVKQTCGNYDADSCTEWGGDFSCANGCELGICKPAVSCSDTIKNGDESDIDCGGSCSVCPNGKSCFFTNANCQSTYCNPNNICSVPSCIDGWRNGNELGIDCGGPCQACPTPACENPSGGDEFIVNTNLEVGQVYPAIAMNTNGNFVVTWQSGLQDGDGNGVYAQRFDSNANPQGPEFKVNTYTTNHQEYSSIAMDINGNFVITWTSYGQDGSSYGIYAQRYSANGEKQGPEFRVNSYTADTQDFPKVAMDANGNFVVVWESRFQDGDGGGIYAQRYDAQGNPQGPEFQVNTYTTSNQLYPTIVMGPQGNFIVVWQSQDQDGSSDGIYVRRFDNNGNPLGNEFLVNTNTANAQKFPTIAMDSSANFVITWQSSHTGQSNIYAQRFNSNGGRIEGEFLVNSAANIQFPYPNVAMDSQGDFIITWKSDGSFNIYARRFDFNGNPLGNEFQINTYMTFEDDDRPVAAINSKSNFVILWHSWRNGQTPGSNRQYDIIARNFKCLSLCENGIKDLTETDIDCGGSCTACTDDKSCLISADCQSNYCNPINYCSIPSCTDGWKNGNELGLDCGGSCPSCPESNDNPSGANILHINSQGSETLDRNSDAQDWWAIPGAEITTDGSLAIALSSFKSSNQDYDLYAYGYDAATQLCSSTSTNPSESCSIAVKAGRSYYINVLAYSGSGSYQIQNTFSTIPAPPGQVNNLRETSHTNTAICIDWSKPIIGGNPVYYHIRENIKSTDATQSTTGFCRNDFPPATDVRFTIEACNADGCSASSELTARTDTAITTSSKPVITSFIINSTKISDKPIVSIKGAIENQAGVANNPDFNVKINILSEKLQTINTSLAKITVVDATHANFEYIWVPNQTHYGQIFIASIIASDGNEKTTIEDKIKLSVLKGKKILIDPGHGLINNSGTWEHTRPWCKRNDTVKTVDCSLGSGKNPSAGFPDIVINEGLNTLKIAKELKILLENESAIVNTTRNLTLESSAGRSGRPAWEEGAYEYLIKVKNEGITVSSAGNKSIAENKDINVRWQYSNEIVKPDFVISVHTNAAGGTGSQFVVCNEIQRDNPNWSWGANNRMAKYNDIISIANKTMRPAVLKTLWGEELYGKHDRALYPACAAIIRLPTAPSALVEVAYHDNYNDHVNLTQQAFLQRAAQSILDGIESYFAARNNVNLTILTLRVNAYSPFKVKVSVTDEDGELTSDLNGQKINETNLEVYLVAPGESPSPEKKQEFTAEEISTGIYELTIDPKGQIIGESSDLYISLKDPTEPEGQQLSDLAIAQEAVYISDPEGKPVVSLISPFNDSVERGKINFTYKANDDGNIESCSLLINGAIKETKTDVIRDTEQIFEQTLVDGAYFWNVECKDNTNLVGASSVYQLSVELDTDNDGILDKSDNCPSTANPAQEDNDNDGKGDVCDICINDPQNDIDADSICGDTDNCPLISNPDQFDTDKNTIGDACNEFEDSDNDEYADNLDNCPLIGNSDQKDVDNDKIGDVCDSQTCNNGILESPEECDILSLGGKTCKTQGFNAGTLLCSASCTLDTSQCSKYVCGNNIIEENEVCDGTALAGQTCQTLGFNYGTLSCQQDCTDYNKVQCTNTICGNKIKDPGEECDDGNTANGDGCSSLCKIEAARPYCDEGDYVYNLQQNDPASGYIKTISAAYNCPNPWKTLDVDKDGYEERYLTMPQGGKQFARFWMLCKTEPKYKVDDFTDPNLNSLGCAFDITGDHPTKKIYCNSNTEYYFLDLSFSSPTTNIRVPSRFCFANDTAKNSFGWSDFKMEWCIDLNNNGVCDGTDRFEPYLIIYCGEDADCAPDQYCKKPTLSNPLTYTCESKCGNSKKDPGEECDDGNLLNGDGCSSLCKREAGITFLRGDSNIDGKVDISDPINTLNFLFLGTGRLECKDSADANDDNKTDISDAVYTLNFLFSGGPIIKQPYPERGIDPTMDTLTCESYSPPAQAGGGGGGSVQTVKEALNETKNNKTIDNQTKSFVINYLEKIPKGNLSITTSPSSAYIYLDGVYKGLTPKAITNLTAGNYTLKLTKYGHYDYKTVANIQPGKTTKLSPTLLQQLSTTPSPSPSPSLSPS